MKCLIIVKFDGESQLLMVNNRTIDELNKTVTDLSKRIINFDEREKEKKKGNCNRIIFNYKKK